MTPVLQAQQSRCAVDLRSVRIANDESAEPEVNDCDRAKERWSDAKENSEGERAKDE